jgi:Flp pilus assembly pilin Flp
VISQADPLFLDDVDVDQGSVRGATMVEYALLVGLMGLALLAALSFMREGVSSQFSTVNSAMQ